MSKVYIVLAYYSSDISYGVDEGTFLCGIYNDEKKAKERVDRLKAINDSIKRKLESLSYDNYEWEDEEDAIYQQAEEELGFPVRPYLDDSWTVTFEIHVYDVNSDINDNNYLGGASYAE